MLVGGQGLTYADADAADAVHDVAWEVLVEGRALQCQGDGAAVAAAVVRLCVVDVGGRLGAVVLVWLVGRAQGLAVEAVVRC